MNSATLVLLALALLQSVLEQAKISGAPLEVIESLEAAIEKLLQVQGSPVTMQQLEDLRTTFKW